MMLSAFILLVSVSSSLSSTCNVDRRHVFVLYPLPVEGFEFYEAMYEKMEKLTKRFELPLPAAYYIHNSTANLWKVVKSFIGQSGKCKVPKPIKCDKLVGKPQASGADLSVILPNTENRFRVGLFKNAGLGETSLYQAAAIIWQNMLLEIFFAMEQVKAHSHRGVAGILGYSFESPFFCSDGSHIYMVEELRKMADFTETKVIHSVTTVISEIVHLTTRQIETFVTHQTFTTGITVNYTASIAFTTTVHITNVTSTTVMYTQFLGITNVTNVTITKTESTNGVGRRRTALAIAITAILVSILGVSLTSYIYYVIHKNRIAPEN